jgi:FixJ family two-component response regulator
MNSRTIRLGEIPPQTGAEEHADIPRASVRRPVVLVVDDDEPLREALRLIFDHMFEVRLAGSGPDALSGLQRGTIDVAVVDLRMPGMSGIEFIERLRVIDPEVQTVILSGQNTFEMARKAVRLGVFDFLPKPFELQVLRLAVQQAARRRDWLRFERKREAALRLAALNGDAALHERHLLASITGEISDALAGITGGLEALEVDLGRATLPSSDQIQDWRREVATLARQAALCRRISKPPQTEVQSPPATVDAAPVFEDLRRLLRAHRGAKRHQLTVRPPSDPIHLRAHPVAVLRILSNLGRNALEACVAPHQVFVESWISTEPARLPESRPDEGCIVLRDTFDNRPPAVVVEVRDTGPGIPPALWRHLFVHPLTTKHDQGDVGLGLSVIRELVSTSRCALHLKTTPGVGTSAFLWIPAAVPDGHKPPPA